MLATLESKLATLGGVLLVVLGLLSFGLYERSSAISAEAAEATYKQDYAQTQAVNKADVAALAQYQALQAKYDAVEAAEAAQEQTGAALATGIAAAAQAAPTSQNGPVAPVLSNALNALRGAQ
jgi:hypothetical protein